MIHFIDHNHADINIEEQWGFKIRRKYILTTLCRAYSHNHTIDIKKVTCTECNKLIKERLGECKLERKPFKMGL